MVIFIFWYILKEQSFLHIMLTFVLNVFSSLCAVSTLLFPLTVPSKYSAMLYIINPFVAYTQQKKKVNTLSSSDFSYKTVIKSNKLYIKLKVIKFSFTLLEKKIRINFTHEWTHLFFSSRVQKWKLQKLTICHWCVNAFPHNGNKRSNLHNGFIFEWEAEFVETAWLSLIGYLESGRSVRTVSCVHSNNIKVV